jgi:transposase InsO family protein
LQPCKETITAEELVTVLNSRVVGEKGYPKTVLSDRDVRCTATVFREWCEQHDIEQRLTTAYHSRGNGQTERFNLTLENYLRAYVQPSLDNWDELLPMAQLAINNSFQESIQTTPYYLNHGRHPYVPGLTTLQRAGVTKGAVDSPERARWLKAKADARASWPAQLRDAIAKAKECLAGAADRMKRQFDRKRTPKVFEVGQRVWLSTRNLKFKSGNCPKIQDRFCGPFTIEERVGQVSYKLTLPETMRVHPVFHVELLREYKGEEFTPPPPILCEDGVEKHTISKILKVKGSGKRQRYLVHWDGYGHEHDTWEPRSTLLMDCPEIIQEFQQEQLLRQAVERPKKRTKLVR